MRRVGTDARVARHRRPVARLPTLQIFGKTARAAAAEREQLVAISDIINAFPKETVG